MQHSKHTPGPWEAQILENSAPYITAREINLIKALGYSIRVVQPAYIF